MIPERTMRRHEALQTLVESLPIGIVHTRDEVLITCNDAFARLVGRSVEELLGTNLFSHLTPEDAARTRARYQARKQGEAVPELYEVELRKADGGIARVEVQPRLVGDEELVILVRDTGSAARDIELANRLSALALRLQRERGIDAVLASTTRGLHELGMQMFALRQEGDCLVVDPAGLTDELANALEEQLGTRMANQRLPIESDSLASRVLAEGRAVYLDDMREPVRRTLAHLLGGAPTDSQVADLVARFAMRKGVAAPLYVSDRPWGMLFVGADGLSTRDAATVALFAAQMASAMEIAHTIDELDRSNRRLTAVREVARAGAETELERALPRLLEVAATSTASDRSVIFLFDPEAGRLTLAGSHGVDCSAFDQMGEVDLSVGPVADVFSSRQPVRLGGIAAGRIREALLMPLSVQGRVCGVLCLGRVDDRPYDDEDTGVAEPLAAQLAIQVENARLYTETRRRMELLSVLNGLSRTMSGTLDPEQLACRALEVLTERLGVDAGWIYGVRDDRLHLVGQRGRSGVQVGEACGADLPLDRSTVCGACMLDQRPIVLDLEQPSLFHSPAGEALGIRHLAAWPLVVDGRRIGTVSLGRKGLAGFHEEELQLLESSAVQLALALERAQLFEEERRRAHDLSRINELGSLIAQHLELPALLSVGVDHLVRLVDAPHVFLSLLEPDGGPLRVVASNLREPGVFDIELQRDAPSAAAAAVRELRPVLIDEPLRDPRGSRALTMRFGHRSVLAVPLISRGEPIGAVVLGETREGRRFHAAAIERAVAMANQLAAAIANARLFEEERHRVRELSLLSELGRIASGTLQREVLLAESLGHIRTGLHFDTGSAWVVHRGSMERVLHHPSAALPVNLEPLALRAVAAAAPICEIVDGVHTCAVPLVAGAEVGGVFAFARRQRPLGDAELRTLSTAAPELGVALQNARLFDDARGRVEELRLLLDVGRAITGSLDLEQILETSAGVLSRFIDGSNTFILLLDPAVGELRGVACSNPAWREGFRSTRIGLEEKSIAARCIRARQPLAVADVAASEFAGSPRTSLYGERSLLALPLLVRDEPIGCVVVDDVRRPRAWSPAEIERATLIAHQVAVAVANAGLYDDLKRSYGELARTQEELVKRERLAALGELSAVVAHEVRNPLGVIFNSLGSMRRLLRPTGDGAMLLDIVEEEADRLDRIVRDLLDFARPHEPALEAESLPELVADTLKAADADERIAIRVEIPADLPPLRIDARMIRQVLLNLVLNGMQAMPRGGTMRIGAAVDPGQPNMVRIEVADEGTGVPAELEARLFQPFFTTKAAGTGLGLAVVKRFVEAHRGTITFHSRQGEGTTFTLRLPMDEASGR